MQLHVSFDVDFLDPAVAPGTGTVVPGGTSYREAHLVMEMLCDFGARRLASTWSSSTRSSTSAASSAVAVTELVASLFGRTVLDRRPGAVSAA